MLLLAAGQAGEEWDPPKKLICSSDFRTGRFLTFPLGERLSPSAKRGRASRSSLLRAWPQDFHTQKQDFSRFLRFLQRCWWRFRSPEMPSVWLWSWRYYAPPKVGNSSLVNTQKTRVFCSICIPVLAPPSPLRFGWPRALSTAVHGWKISWGCSWPVISTNSAIASFLSQGRTTFPFGLLYDLRAANRLSRCVTQV